MTISVAPAQAVEGSGWQHALQVAADLRDDPPDVPVVLLLGGSCAREATVGDADWAAEVRRRSGRSALTFDLGSRNQTFEQDVALVKALPRMPMLIFIGVNRGRFASPPTLTTSTSPIKTNGKYTQHHYSSASIHSRAQKQKQVKHWVRRRYPVFEARYAANLARLDELIGVCIRRGYRPVLLDLPRNTAVIGDVLRRADRQVSRRLPRALLAPRSPICRLRRRTRSQRGRLLRSGPSRRYGPAEVPEPAGRRDDPAAQPRRLTGDRSRGRRRPATDGRFRRQGPHPVARRSRRRPAWRRACRPAPPDRRPPSSQGTPARSDVAQGGHAHGRSAARRACDDRHRSPDVLQDTPTAATAHRSRSLTAI